MNILHVIASIDPTHGGPSVCVPSLAAAQAELGHDTTVAFQTRPRERFDVGATRSTIPGLDRVKMVAMSIENGIEGVTARRAGETLGGLLRDADVVHVHGLWDPVVLRAGYMALRARKPYVVTPHGMLNSWSLARRRVAKALVRRCLVDELLRGSRFVHALNRAEHDAIAALDPQFRPRIYPNGVFAVENAASATSDALLKRWPMLAGRRYALFLGRLHIMKGLDYLVEAFGKIAPHVPDVDLVLAGPDDGYEADLRQRIAALGMEARVHVAGPVLGLDKFALLRGAQCYVQTSRNEGFSMSILEALSCGVPVVISETCYFPEAAAGGVGFVVPLRSEDIASAMTSLLDDRSTREQMAARTQSFIASNYTWQAVARAMTSGYSGEEN